MNSNAHLKTHFSYYITFKKRLEFFWRGQLILWSQTLGVLYLVFFIVKCDAGSTASSISLGNPSSIKNITVELFSEPESMWLSTHKSKILNFYPQKAEAIFDKI